MSFVIVNLLAVRGSSAMPVGVTTQGNLDAGRPGGLIGVSCRESCTLTQEGNAELRASVLHYDSFP